jgi:hypothetical protein
LIRLSLLISLLALAIPASAQATWTGMDRISSSEQGAKVPDIGVDQSGNAVIAYSHYDGSDTNGVDVPGKTTCCFRVEARRRTASGTLGAPIQISAPAKNATQPHVAVDANGNATFVWVVNNGINDIIQTRRLTSANVLSTIQTLSAAGQNSDEPQVALDGAGNAYYAWERFDGSNGDVCCFRTQIRKRTASSAALTVVQTVSAAGQTSFSPQIGVDTNGNATVVWVSNNGTKNVVNVVRRATAGGLSSVQAVSNTTINSQEPQLAVRPSNGDTYLIWIEKGTVDIVKGRVRAGTATGTLSAIDTLSSTTQYSEEAQVAMDPNGNVIATWERFDGTNPSATPPCCWRIESRTRTQAGALGTTEIHSTAGQNSFAPQVAYDANGNASLIWGRFDGTNPTAKCCFLIQTRRKASTGTLSTIQTLSLTGQNAKEPQVAADNAGAVFAWTRFDGKYDRIQARRRLSSGTLQGLQTVSTVGPDAFTGQVAVDPSGNGIFVWQAFDGAHTSIQARTATPAGALLSVIQQLSDSTQNAAQPQVAVDGSGNALFVWKRLDGSSGTTCCYRIEARRRAADGTLGPVELLSPAGQNADSPQLAMNASGNSVIAWTRSDGTNIRIEAVARDSAGVLSAVQQLSPAGRNASEPQDAIDANGNATFTWTRSDGTNNRIEEVTRKAAGTLTTVKQLSPVGQNASQPEVGVRASTGDAVFVWMRFDGTKNRIQTRAKQFSNDALSTVATLSVGGQNASQPEIAVDPNGIAIYSWTRFDGSSGTCCFKVQTVARSATGTLSSIKTLSPDGGNAGLGQVAVDGSGNAVYVWRFDGTDKRIQARTRSSAGTIGELVPISNATLDADLPQVSVNATGKAFAVWQRFDTKKSRIEGAVGP